MEARLEKLTDTTFTVVVKRDKYHFPLHSILSVVEPEDGVKLDGPLLNRKHAAIAVTVNQLVLYKGAFALGMSFPV